MKRIIVGIALIVCCLRCVAQPICTVTKYDESGGQPLWHVTQMLQDRQGMIWLSTWNGLLRFDGYDMTCFKSHVGDGCDIPTDRIRNIQLLENGNILCQIDEQTFVFDLQTYCFRATNAKFEAKSSSVILNDKELVRHTDNHGTEWILHRDGRMEYVDTVAGRVVEYPLESPIGEVKACFPDRQGNLWAFGTYSVSRLSFARCPVEMIPMERDVQIRSLLVDAQKRCWLTGRGDATVRILDEKGGHIGYLSASGHLSRTYTSFGSSVYCVFQSSDGTIWLGCKPDGLFRLKELNDKTFSIERIGGLNDNDVYDIAEDGQGRLWIATLGGGINCLPNPNESQPRVLTPDNAIGGYPQYACRKVRRLHITDSGTLMAASTEGLVVGKIDGDTVLTNMKFNVHTREADRANSLSCSATMDIVEDKRGRIFVATESGGVNMIMSANLLDDMLAFRHYNMQSGLASDITLSVVAFDERLLVVGNSMITELNPDNGILRTFDSRFLRFSCRFSDAHPVCLPDGRWLFGLHNGAFAVRPEVLRRSDFVPPIAITSIYVQNVKELLAANSLDTLVLNPDGRDAMIRFAALDYVDAEALEYAFRLCGEDADSTWNYIGRNTSVPLLDLVPGEYRLQIRSTNADGVWVDNARNLVIVVVPKFTETVFAKVLLIIILLLVLSATVYTVLYIRRIHRNQRELLEAYLALLNKTDEEPVDVEAQEKPLRSNISSEDDMLMKRITAFVDQHIADTDITIGDMADAVAMSRSGLQRKMKQMLGVTPLDFLREARIKRACHLLIATETTVAEIAFECGFSDPKYFSRTFKASVGASPREYRDRG